MKVYVNKNRVKRTFLLACLFIIFPPHVYCGIIGSTTVVSLQSSAANFPQADTNNTMLGFTVFDAGFVLENAQTTCTFDAYFPVRGSVYINDGKLYLNRDLVFSASLDLMTSGKIYGKTLYSVVLPSSISKFYLPKNSAVNEIPIYLDNVSLVMQSDLQIQTTVRINGYCKIDGRDKVLLLNERASFVVRPGSKLVFENVDIQGIKQTNIRCLTDSGSIIFDNAILNLSQDYSFSRGAILWMDDVVITGSRSFVYTSGLTSTINTKSILMVDDWTTFNYSPRRAKKNLFYMQDSSSILFLNGCSIYSTRTGLELSRGTMMLDKRVTFSSGALYDSEAITLKSDLNVKFDPAAVLDLYGRIMLD